MLKKSLQISILGLAALAPMSVDAQNFKGGDDIALIWIGDRHRPDWTKELFTPYIVHTYEDGHKSWFFDGFLFLDSSYLEKDGSVRYTFGEADFTPSKKEHWELLLQRQMGLETGLGVKALDERIGELKAEMGELTYKHKIVMMTPIPNAKSARNWGSINNRELNFEDVNDRVAAISWYVDLMIEKFKEANFQNVELSGIYWLRESVEGYAQEDVMATLANQYIHSRNLMSYWIPYFTASNIDNSKKLGFDWTYIQPNYVFNMDTPDSQLDQAIENAWSYDIGLEMEFEGKCINGYDGITDTRELVQQWNSSMYDVNPTLYARFKRYIDMFESESCFDAMPLSYYNGYQAIFDFQNSPNPKDRQLLDRLASILEKRHILGGWHEASGISEVESEMRLNIYATNGGIFIGSGCPAATIYSIDGRVITTTTAGGESTVYCDPGIYIVRCGDTSVKVRVR